MSVIVEYVKAESSKRGTGLYIEISYKNLTGDYAGQVWKKGNFATKLDADTRDLVKTLSKGDKITLDTEIIEKDGKKYYNLKSVRKASEKSIDNRPIMIKTSQAHEKKPFDDVGIKVGAARNQSIAFLSATKGTKFNLDDVDEIAYEIVKRQAAQEATIRAGVLDSNTDTDTDVSDVDANDDDLEF